MITETPEHVRLTSVDTFHILGEYAMTHFSVVNNQMPQGPHPYISLIQLFSPGRWTEPSPVRFHACRQGMLHTKAAATANQDPIRPQSRAGRAPGQTTSELLSSEVTYLGVIPDLFGEVVPEGGHYLHVLPVHDVGGTHLRPCCMLKPSSSQVSDVFPQPPPPPLATPRGAGVLLKRRHKIRECVTCS